MDANSTPTAPAPTTIRVFGISGSWRIERLVRIVLWSGSMPGSDFRSEEHTSELQSQSNLVCRLLLEKKKYKRQHRNPRHLTLAVTLTRAPLACTPQLDRPVPCPQLHTPHLVPLSRAHPEITVLWRPS